VVGPTSAELRVRSSAPPSTDAIGRCGHPIGSRAQNELSPLSGRDGPRAVSSYLRVTTENRSVGSHRCRSRSTSTGLVTNGRRACCLKDGGRDGGGESMRSTVRTYDQTTPRIVCLVLPTHPCRTGGRGIQSCSSTNSAQASDATGGPATPAFRPTAVVTVAGSRRRGCCNVPRLRFPEAVSLCGAWLVRDGLVAV
jgi:hypothetical protein